MTAVKKCPCKSGKLFSNCCEQYLILNTEDDMDYANTLLVEWIKKYAPPIKSEFSKKMKSYVFRISYFLEVLIARYLYFDYEANSKSDKSINETILSIKHNTLLTIFGGFSCFEQGLFMQSGILFRSVIENCMVIIDLCEHGTQRDKFLKDKYSVNGLVGRVKYLIPDFMIDWYGYFSRNFTHFGPLHSVSIIPAKCWPDNWLLVTGIQNIVRSCCAFGLTIERIHFDVIRNHFFWERKEGDTSMKLIEDGPVWDWLEDIRKDILNQYPPNERKEGIIYSDKSIKLK
ncbi:MAG: hypothetical protein JXA96_07185 [Sedimentisphaerales bacterium]|nr:hypothetical protein [Sedimentisphaerales bacterium]